MHICRVQQTLVELHWINHKTLPTFKNFNSPCNVCQITVAPVISMQSLAFQHTSYFNCPLVMQKNKGNGEIKEKCKMEVLLRHPGKLNLKGKTLRAASLRGCVHASWGRECFYPLYEKHLSHGQPFHFKENMFSGFTKALSSWYWFPISVAAI